MGNKQSKVDEILLDNKLQRDKLNKYKSSLDRLIALNLDLAKNALKMNDVTQAKKFIQIKNQNIHKQEEIEKQLASLTGLISSIETQVAQQRLVEQLEKGNKLLTGLHKEMKYQNEISNLIITHDPDLDQELDGLKEEIRLPNEPKTELKEDVPSGQSREDAQPIAL
ncbi:hypothetical protein E3Q06_01588 [Wallemia mellicola]|uniref:Uncharacterized protein n=1 Tax=Wallemia mellicola TaxID=1708541 RepID=A0AB38N1W5_9BASI|nr:hypothetical protein E3Q07_01668 [Wallemia mellicola]TIC49991.1 hypothetical protein E3Q06_01588 [Wallemia mellicola]TIC66909.1 hypothetical protein E3Q02_01679 [Wallemia mellicola]